MGVLFKQEKKVILKPLAMFFFNLWNINNNKCSPSKIYNSKSISRDLGSQFINNWDCELDTFILVFLGLPTLFRFSCKKKKILYSSCSGITAIYLNWICSIFLGLDRTISDIKWINNLVSETNNRWFNRFI